MGSRSGFILPEDVAKAPEVRPLEPGTVVDGRFVIRDVLGRGGFSVVYRAEQTSMGRQVALKVLRSDLVTEDAARRRFLREVRAVASLSSPHSISVFDAGTTPEGQLYIAMELLKGTSLYHVMARDHRAMAVQRAIQLVDQVLESLDEAHGAGILHRDLKPENLFLVPSSAGGDFVKVLDFGIAAFADDPDDPATTAPVGTPEYMSPEQLQGRKLDARSDLYSLGTILFELLSGLPPVTGATPMDVARRKLTEDPPSLRDLNPAAKVPPELELFLQRALARDPDLRPANVTEFRNLLLLALDDEGTPVAEAPAPEPEVPATRPPPAPATQPPAPTTGPATLRPAPVGKHAPAATPVPVAPPAPAPAPVAKPAPVVVAPATPPDPAAVPPAPQAQAPRPVRPAGAAAFRERRGAAREPRNLSVSFLLHGQRFRAVSLDVSALGAFFHSTFIPPIGARLAMIFSAGQPPTRHLLTAEVIRVVAQPEGPGEVRGFGVRWHVPPGLLPPRRFADLLDPRRRAPGPPAL